MTQDAPKIRLFVTAALGPGAAVELPREQAHYLGGVMRRAVGDEVLVFNGRDGEWRATIRELSKRAGALEPLSQTRAQAGVPDLWLCFAPVKKAQTDFIAEKACELGCARLQPVFTRFTNSERVNTERLRANAIEAAEQCGGLSVPEVAEPVKLEALLQNWPDDRRLVFCDERRQAALMPTALTGQPAGAWAVLIGPEGGFSEEEAALLRAHPATLPVSLGPRVLRAETAAVAALTLWQAALGDWR